MLEYSFLNKKGKDVERELEELKNLGKSVFNTPHDYFVTADLVDNNWGEVILVRDTNRLVGARLSYNNLGLDREDGRRYNFSSLCCVLPEYQHQGIGTNLVKMGHQSAINKGIDLVVCQIAIRNKKGTNFVEKLGYELKDFNELYKKNNFEVDIELGLERGKENGRTYSTF